MEKFAARSEDAAVEVEGLCLCRYCAVWEDWVCEKVVGVLGVALGEE